MKSTDIHASPVSLADLRRGESGVVTALTGSRVLDDRSDDAGALLVRLRDLGFVAGARCEIVARMWGGDPLVVRIGGSMFALRRAEAAAVRVLRQQERLSPRAALEPKDASAAVA